MTSPRYDAIIVGGGHNGLVAAAYLAGAGKRVALLERLDTVGGAAVSAEAFTGQDARLSRYSYLVSLLPKRIIEDLGLDLTLLRRRYSSYTPVPGGDGGLLIDNGDAAATLASFSEVGAAEDAEAFARFYADTTALAEAIWPTLTEPLLTRSEVKRLVGNDELWTAFVERPIGQVIEERFTNDLVRGVVATDALIGTFADLRDDSLAQNRCFLYHVIGGGTGDWDVPAGGMGSVTGALWHAAVEAGAEIITGAEVTRITVTAGGEAGAFNTVDYNAVAPDTTDPAATAEVSGHSIEGDYVLANVAPWVLRGLLAQPTGPDPVKPEGAQVKVNLLLSRLPRLKDSSVSTEAAFGGTFHINELYSQLNTAFATADGGSIPYPLPAEIYCHSLTDPSILSPELREIGAQTLTVFGLHTPDRLVTAANNTERRAELQAAVLASLNSVLAEPIEGCLLTDADGNPCIETKTTLDIEDALHMPGGNIFHGPLSWPFAENNEDLSSPATRWGVATAHPTILMCGSGSRRGGAVSGLGGHSAAMALLELGETP
jgi:phytoene dehydrogenase-like protein